MHNIHAVVPRLKRPSAAFTVGGPPPSPPQCARQCEVKNHIANHATVREVKKMGEGGGWLLEPIIIHRHPSPFSPAQLSEAREYHKPLPILMDVMVIRKSIHMYNCKICMPRSYIEDMFITPKQPLFYFNLVRIYEWTE